MDKIIVGVFSLQGSAIKAIQDLKNCGYEDEDISVLTKDKDKLDRIADMTDTSLNNSSADGALGGAVTGGIAGGISALLVGLGVFVIPGMGPLLAAGPIAVGLAGIAAGTSVGGVVGVLAGLGVDMADAKEYETYLNRGDIIVLVDDIDGKGKLVCDAFAKHDSLVKDKYSLD